jgi:hypothetical protein
VGWTLYLDAHYNLILHRLQAVIIRSFFFFLIVFALGGSPTPHPISSRPHFVCKFSRHDTRE